MNHLSSTSELTETTKELGLFPIKILEGNSSGLILTHSQIDLVQKELDDDQMSEQNVLQVCQSQQDPIWEELLKDTSHKVAQVLLAMLWNPDIGNGLILAPGIDTTGWHNEKNGWIQRTTPSPHYLKKPRNSDTNNLYKIKNHKRKMVYLPPHTDPAMVFYNPDTGDYSNSINSPDLKGKSIEIQHVYGRFLYGDKYYPTDFYYMPDDLSHIPHGEQAYEMDAKYWDKYLAVCKVEEIREHVKKKVNVPSIGFHRNTQYSGFSIHAPIEYPILADLPHQDQIYRNQIGHSGYVTPAGEASGFTRDIYSGDIETVFGEYGLKNID